MKQYTWLIVLMTVWSTSCWAMSYHDQELLDLALAGNTSLLRLICLAKEDEPEQIKRVLAAGANPEVTLPSTGQTVLHLLAQNGYKKMSKELLSSNGKPINVNAQDFEGNTPLHEAALMQNMGIYKLLKKYGASETIKNNSGETATKIAQSGQQSLWSILFK